MFVLHFEYPGSHGTNSIAIKRSALGRLSFWRQKCNQEFTSRRCLWTSVDGNSTKSSTLILFANGIVAPSLWILKCK